MKAKIINENEFQENSFIKSNLVDGISVVSGKLNNSDSLIVQSYEFDDSKFKKEQIDEWFKHNKIKYIELEAAVNKKKRYNTDLPNIISSFYISRMINELEAFEENEIEINWLSYGGSVWAGFEFADWLKQTDKKITARVTGLAASMGASLIPFQSLHSPSTYSK